MKKVTMLALCLLMLFACASAEICALCGGDDVCDTCSGNGFLLMQGYGSDEMVKVACTAGCDNGACPVCTACEVCGGLGYLTMKAYGSDEMVKVACSSETCSAGASSQPAQGPSAAEEAAPVTELLLVSPTEYTDGRVFLGEDYSSWDYATSTTFDMDAYIARLEKECGMSLTRINEVGDCIFYDLDYTHPETGKEHTLSIYTFSGGKDFELTVIKPANGGIALPEFAKAEPVTPDPAPTKKPASNNRFVIAMEAYLESH